MLDLIKYGLFRMSINIKKAERGDISGIIELMRGLAEYEKLADYCEITEKSLAAAMFDDKAFVEGIVARDAEKPIAYALFFPYFASFRGQRGFYLEDLYIDGEYRGKGIGEELLREIAKTAKIRGFERIDFQVLDWNEPAIKFYEKLGAESNSDESHFKFTSESFEKLAS